MSTYIDLLLKGTDSPLSMIILMWEKRTEKTMERNTMEKTKSECLDEITGCLWYNTSIVTMPLL